MPARSQTRDAYAVVVVGGGIGGLTAAALLTRSGVPTLLVEAQTSAGGYVHAFERGPYVFDPAVHLLVDPPMWDRLLRHLGVRGDVAFLTPPQFFTAAFPGLRVHAPFGYEPFVDAHVAALPAHAGEIRAFFATCARLHREAHELPSRLGLRALDDAAKRLPTVFQYRRATLAQALDDHIGDPRARALCGAAALELGLPPSTVSFQTFAQMVFGHVSDGAAYVAGGLQRIVDALVAAVRRNGGDVLLGRRVTRIIVEGGRARGIQMADGEVVQANAVVSNADPVQTFERMVGAEHLPAAFMRNLRRLVPSISGCLLFGATTLDLREHEIGHMTFLQRSWDPETTYRRTLAGDPAGIVLNVPTLVDATLAPAGEHVVVATTFVPYDAGRPWPELKARFHEGLLAATELALPGVRDRLALAETATPLALERFSLNHRGAIYGWGNTPEQTGSRRPDQRTPLDGLFLAGHWTAPGPGFIRAVGSGVRCAELVLDATAADVSIPRFSS